MIKLKKKSTSLQQLAAFLKIQAGLKIVMEEMVENRYSTTHTKNMILRFGIWYFCLSTAMALRSHWMKVWRNGRQSARNVAKTGSKKVKSVNKA